MDISNKAFGIHERALHLRAQRMETIAQNIANADTPNYKARDINFKAMLNNALSAPMRATQSNHYAVAELPGAADGMRYRVPFNTPFDGNTVEMSVEQAAYGKAAMDYQTTLNFLEKRIAGVRKALRGE